MDIIDLQILATHLEICQTAEDFREVYKSNAILLNAYIKANYNKFKRRQDTTWLEIAESRNRQEKINTAMVEMEYNNMLKS